LGTGPCFVSYVGCTFLERGQQRKNNKAQEKTLLKVKREKTMGKS